MLRRFVLRIRRNLFPIITCSLALIILLIFLFSNNGIENLRQLLPRIQVGWLLLAITTAIITMLLEGYSLHLLCKHLYPEWTFGRSLTVGMTGLLYSAITPFSTGGQPMQIYSMRKMGMDIGKASSIIAMKTLSYQIIMVLYALLLVCMQLGFFVTHVSNLAVLTIAGLLSNSTFIFFVMLFTISEKATKKILHFIIRWLYKLRICKKPLRRYYNIHKQLSMFHDSAKLMGRSWKLYLPIIVITILQITFTGSIVYMIYRSFNLPAANTSMLTMLAANQFVAMVSAFIPLPGASGGAEGSFLVFFRTFFQNTITPAILIWRVITYYLNILLGAIVSSIGGKKYYNRSDEELIREQEKKPSKENY